jgi:hypothetical protein
MIALRFIRDVDFVAVTHVKEADSQLGRTQINTTLFLWLRLATQFLVSSQQTAQCHRT